MKGWKWNGEVFETFCSRFVLALGLLLTGLLSLYSLRYTEHFYTNRDESMELTADCIPVTLLLMALTVAAAFVIARLLLRREEHRRRNIRIFLGFVCVYTMAYGFLWSFFCKYYMIGDARLVSFFAEQLALGIDDVSASDIQYITSYPHQMGMVPFIEPLYRLFGWENYHAFQALNALGAGAVVWLGFRILREITGREEPGVYFLVLMLGCHPLMIYVSFFYGEVLSVTFLFLAVYALLLYLRRGLWRYGVLLAAALTLACLVRSNSYIVVAAVGCVLAVKVISEKKARHGLTFAACIALFLVTHTLLFQNYERRLGVELDAGMPYSLWVAMGLQESIEDKEPGWFNKFSEEVFVERTNQNPEEADAIAREAVADSLRNFAEHPDYALQFFKSKLLSMWNEPTYACLLETSRHREERSALADRVYKGDLWLVFVRVMDVYQSLIYCGAFLCCAFLIWRRIPAEGLIFFVIVLGGFLFYVFWEAKSRYILPYFLSMVPMAAWGWEMTVRKILEWGRSVRRG